MGVASDMPMCDKCFRRPGVDREHVLDGGETVVTKDCDCTAPVYYDANGRHVRQEHSVFNGNGNGHGAASNEEIMAAIEEAKPEDRAYLENLLRYGPREGSNAEDSRSRPD